MTAMRELVFRRPKRNRREEGGYVLVTVALVTTILLLFTGLTVDFGSWYNRAAEIQRAADAAALAGVVWMPEYDVARTVAFDTAKKNGFEHGVGGIEVVVEEVEGNNRQLKVTITDTSAPQFFSQLAVDSQRIRRSSVGEYVLPVPLGSPKNTFGTGNLLSGSDRENFWASVNGYCAGHENGDDKLAFYETQNDGGASPNCNKTGNTMQSDTYDPDGYLYAIDLKQNVSSLKLEIYDAPYYTSGSDQDDRYSSVNQSITTIVEIYDRNPTPLDLTNLTLLQTYTFTTNQSSGTYQNQWFRLRTWNNAQAGQYYVRVKTLAGQMNSRGSNGFSLRAFTGNNFSVCTTITGASGYSASCPQIHGVADVSILANLEGSTAEFFLAEIDPVHAGKTMRITLFDTGEGANSLQILDPNGTARTINWSTFCNPPTPPSGGCSGSGTTLSVSGSGTQPYTDLNSTSKYNDRYIIIDIPLPVNYTQTFGTKRWWKIRYSVGSTPTDRTTWSVNIVGDPVHLVK